MILALLFALLSGSADSAMQSIIDQLAGRIDTVVSDKAERRQLQAIVEKAGDTTKSFEKSRRKIHDHWVDLGKDKSATGAQYEALFASLRQENEAYQREMIRHRFALRDRMSRGDWEKVYPPVQ
jgi:hypothetical protein